MPKLLADFLQEQQEPFALDAFLLERGYSIRKRRRRRLECSGFVGAVVRRLVSRGKRNVGASGDEVSLETCTTKYDTCSEDGRSSEEGVFGADRERKLKWREEGSKQLSPVSVLEETESDEGSPIHQKQGKMKTATLIETSTSISESKSPHNNRVKAMHEFNQYSNPYAQYAINKRALQQTKRLLVDCVREVIEQHRRGDQDGKGRQLKKILGSEELWKLVCENVWAWSQDPVDRTNILHLLRSDFAASDQQGWDSGAARRKEEISADIGDAVLADIIDEIVSFV